MNKIKISIIGLFTILVYSNSSAQICNADFLYGMNQNTVSFFDSSYSQGNYGTYWTFGDGQSSTKKNPTHTYNSNGTYTACLIIVDSINNCTDSACYSIKIGNNTPKCNAKFTFGNNGGYVSFSPKSVSPSTSYFWSFGNSKTSNLKSPTHQYTKSGYYYVCLTVKDSASNCTDYFCDSIFVSIQNNNGCDASFSYKKSGSDVNFFSFDSISSYHYWDFGDGKSSTQINPKHTYSKDGSYTVCLIVSDSLKSCLDSFCKTIDIKTNTIKCNASWGYGDSGLLVNFYHKAQSSQSTQYLWDFGDNNTSTLRNPVHTYSKPGSYTVCLVVGDSLNNCMDTFCQKIKVDSLHNKKCQASFYTAIDSSQKYTLFLIQNSTGTSANTTYLWDFGDGTKSNKKKPNHQYKNFGLYNVCLTISDNNQNCSSIYCDSVGMDANGKLLKLDGFNLIVLDEDELSILNPISKNLVFSIYPNPTTGIFNLNLGDDVQLIGDIEIYNINGQKVLSIKAEKNGTEINASALENGSYYMKAKTSKGLANGRIIISQ